MNPVPISNLVQNFFADFERASNTFDGSYLAAQFSDTFMTADPDGTTRVASRQDMLAVTPKRQAFFQSIGFQFVKMQVLSELQLSDQYLMVKVEAHMRFEKDASNPVDLKDISTYILFVKDVSPKIVFYLTHGDLIRIMQAHGLLPEKP